MALVVTLKVNKDNKFSIEMGDKKATILIRKNTHTDGRGFNWQVVFDGDKEIKFYKEKNGKENSVDSSEKKII